GPPQDQPRPGGAHRAAARAARARVAARGPPVLFAELEATSRKMAATSARSEKVSLLASLLRRLDPEEIAAAVAFLSAGPRQGRIGVGPSAVRAAASGPRSRAPELTLADVDSALERIAHLSGPGSAAERARSPSELLGPAPEPEASLLIRLLLGEALERIGEAALEYKLDGARIQVHRSGDEVRVFSRQLNDVTHAVPELVETVRALPSGELILDGEVLALRPDGTPHPFQVTMR